MSKEAMKLALEAMERYQVKRQDFDRFADEITALREALANEALDKKAENARELGLDYDVKSDHRLMEQPAQQEPVEVKQIAEALRQIGLTLVRTSGSFRVMDLGRIEAQTTSPPAQQELDPLAGDARDDWNDWRDDQGVYPTALNPPAKQEPVAYLCENAVGHKYFRWKKPSSTYKPIALYTSPPAQRPWVGLTLERKMDMAESYFTDEWAINRAIQLLSGCETALKEENT
jgi:hypothetical protein